RAKVLSKQKINSLDSTLNAVPLCSGNACNLLSMGDKVRVELDNPINPVDNKRLHGRFRSTDLRWDPKIRIIRRVILTPNKPPLYLLDGTKTRYLIEPVAYSKAQLQPVDEKEPLINKSVVRHKTNYSIYCRIVIEQKED
ncbi:MAG: hypothetical protein P4L35_03905, partial [Ignavibacteriaceae bacterium]|nr:hypothetical protein [Ignavibacteriaceae bacterium]